MKLNDSIFKSTVQDCRNPIQSRFTTRAAHSQRQPEWPLKPGIKLATNKRPAEKRDAEADSRHRHV